VAFAVTNSATDISGDIVDRLISVAASRSPCSAAAPVGLLALCHARSIAMKVVVVMRVSPEVGYRPREAFVCLRWGVGPQGGSLRRLGRPRRDAPTMSRAPHGF